MATGSCGSSKLLEGKRFLSHSRFRRLISSPMAQAAIAAIIASNSTGV